MTATKTKTKAVKQNAAAMHPERLQGYFLPYQIEAILNEERLTLWEKSIRIGATYCMGFRGARRRVLGKHGDLLVTSVSLPAAKEFIEQVKQFNEIFRLAASDIEDVSWGRNLDEAGFCIRYPNGRRIFAFSSSPQAIRSFGGEVNIDEWAFHRDPAAMLKAAGGRAMWGFAVAIWSSHNGTHSLWARMLNAERAKGAASDWHIMRTTLIDALDQGLLEKINQVSGLSMTREEFIRQTKAACGGEEAYAEECLCEARAGGDPAIKWGWIERAAVLKDVFRRHIDEDGRASLNTDAAEEAAKVVIETLREDPAQALGYDVARTGHLSAVWCNGKDGDMRRLRSLVTFHNVEFGCQRGFLEEVLDGVPSITGCGDATGLGMNICEDLEKKFGKERFTGINFGAHKPNLGVRLRQVYEDNRQEIAAAGMDEVKHDLAGIVSNRLPTGRMVFSETRNPIYTLSHCDIAWANALALYSDDDQAIPGVY